MQCTDLDVLDTNYGEEHPFLIQFRDAAQIPFVDVIYLL